MKDLYNAFTHSKTKDFCEEFYNLCEKYNLCVVPTYCGKVSFHDAMRIIEFDKDTKEYIKTELYLEN